MKILITGASGAGTSTLGEAIHDHLCFEHLDVDDYYWKKTDPPFQKKVPVEIRKRNFLNDFKRYEKVIISGSLVSWGREWLSAFDLVAFITIEPSIRMKRLENRELERYGSQLQTDPVIQKTSKEFLAWARKYDDPLFEGRSITMHRNWINQLSCPVLTIDGTISLDTKIDMLTSKVASLSTS
ncbi:MAG: AAA family ATPase [Bacteroidota bacterium]